MRTATYLALIDELEKISASGNLSYDLLRALLGKQGIFFLNHKPDDKTKKAGMLQNLGTRIVSGVKAAPRVLPSSVASNLAAPMRAGDVGRAMKWGIQGGIHNAGNAVHAFSSPIQSAKAGWKASVTDFKQMHPAMKALMGAGLVSSAVEVGSKNDPMGQGRSRLNRGITAAGDQIGGLIGTPFGLTGSLVASQIGRKAGGLVGKGVDRLRGYQAPQSQPQATQAGV